MKLILLKDVPRLGQQYEVVDVSDGYANNYLLPQKLAERATEKKIAELDARKEKLQAEKDAYVAGLKETLDSMSENDLTMTAKADDQGNLYKKIQAPDIAKALQEELSIELPETAIMLESPITEVGEHDVTIEAVDTSATLKVMVVKE